MIRPRLAAVAVGAAAVVLLSGCSSSDDSTRDVEIRLQNEINGLTERVTSLESRMAWVEVVGRRAIQANPTAYEEQVVADLAALNAEFAAAQAEAAAVADAVAAQQAAAEVALADAATAVDAAVEAKRGKLVAAIEEAGQRVAAAKAELEALKQQIEDAINGAASPGPS
jgi:chromosome segregation ATPase